MSTDQSKPPISAVDAITFAVEKIDDHYDRLDFLRMWLHREWEEMREWWPEVFVGEVVK
jgi:hypothetical protein